MPGVPFEEFVAAQRYPRRREGRRSSSSRPEKERNARAEVAPTSARITAMGGVQFREILAKSV